jgi:exonuclease SbcD
MRILHTSDWHIGHRLHDNERHKEHQEFLNWLLNTIESQKAELLIIAGDIFDTANPTHEALSQYYDFLRGMIQTCCKHIIIIGGNHDSYGTLNAPKDILRYFNIHIVGKAHENCMDEVIVIKDKADKIQTVVCAVPFLRDRDIRQAISGESYADIEQRIKEGIVRRYRNLADCIQTYKAQSFPVLATGHLYAAGGKFADEGDKSERDIHIGNLGQIRADQFPAEFDYIALGHLHRPQMVNQQQHIRYAGSPIPLSFSEFSDQKVVLLLHFENNHIQGISEIEVPRWRKLVRLKGSFTQIANQIQLLEDTIEPMRIWAEVRVELDQYEPYITQKVNELVKYRNIAVLKTQAIYTHLHQSLDEQIGSNQALHELKPEEVFRKKCESEKFDVEGYPDVYGAFKELLSEMEEDH